MRASTTAPIQAITRSLAAVRTPLVMSTDRYCPASGHKPTTRDGTGRDGDLNDATRAKNPSSVSQPVRGIPAATDTNAVLSACLLYTSPSPRDGLLSRMP